MQAIPSGVYEDGTELITRFAQALHHCEEYAPKAFLEASHRLLERIQGKTIRIGPIESENSAPSQHKRSET